MSKWNILGIEETVDVRKIKLAYSEKLKSTRPDEKPDEFQTLHAAYKSALGEAKRRNRSRDIDEADVEINRAHSSTRSVEAVEKVRPQIENIAKYHHANGEARREGFTPHEDEPVRLNDQQLDAIKQIMERVERHIHDYSRVDARSWAYLTKSPYIMDELFRWQLGIELFKRMLRYYNSDLVQRHGENRINSRVISYFDQIFNWSQNRLDVQDEVKQTSSQKIFDLIKPYEFSTGNVESGIQGGAFTAHNEAHPMDNTEKTKHLLLKKEFWSVVAQIGAVAIIIFAIKMYLNMNS